MLNWLDVLKFANNGNAEPDQRVEKQKKNGNPFFHPSNSE